MPTALLVVDMQNVFYPMVNASLPNVIKLISHFRDHNLPVIFTQHGHTDEELKPPFRNQLVQKWGVEGSIRIGSNDWEFIPAVQDVIKDAPVIAKNTYDAFLGTLLKDALNISDVLEEKKADKIVVCGVMTDCCCDTTARAAFNRGFETCLVGDACGSANKAQHKAGLKAFGFAFGDIVSTGDVLAEAQAGP